MQWDSYPSPIYQGRHYGMKSETFVHYLDMPQRCEAEFALALGGASAPRAQLRKHGWHLHNPNEMVATPWDYQNFIQNSRGEFSVAKAGYVDSRSGWFSERSAAYLASGRPVVTQDTGFTAWLPSGQGLLAFNSIEEAQVACDEIYHHQEAHASAARALAEEYFDSRKVLSRMIESSMAADQPALNTSATPTC